ncbi:MAG: MMPL family transporter [Pseudomonadales bacterium]
MLDQTVGVLVDSLNRRKLVPLFIWVLLICVSIFGATHLTINPNNRVFFSNSDKEFSELLAFESAFSSNTNIIFSITSSSTIFDDPQLVTAVEWVVDEAWKIHGVSRVDSLENYPFGEYSEDEIVLSNVLEVLCPSANCLKSRADEVLKPHLINRFISEDYRTLAVVASVEFDLKDQEAVSRLDMGARLLSETFNSAYPELALHYSGAVPMMQAFVDASNSDLSVLVPVATLAFFLLLWIFLGNFVLSLIMVLLGLFSIVLTLGCAGWFGHIINTATATVPLVIFTLVTAASMHVFLYIARDYSYTREDVSKAVRRAIVANFWPVVLSGLTSVVGLLSLTFVSSPPVQQLGLLSAVGVGFGTLLLLTFAPPLLSLVTRIEPSRSIVAIQRILNWRARKIEAGEDSVIVASLLLALCCVGLPFLKIDEDFVRYFDPSYSFRVNTEAITASLSSPYHAEVIVDTGVSGGIFSPDVVRFVEHLEREIQSRSVVVNVLSMVDVLEEAARVLGGQSDLAKLTAEELAQYFLSFELSLSKGQSTADFVDVDLRKLRISVLFGDTAMRGIRDFEASLRKWIDSNNKNGLEIQITGEGIPTAHLSSESIREMSAGIFVSLLFSSFALGVVYRSAKVVLVSLLAIAVPVLAGFGIWGATVGEIGMAATMVVAVTIGVVIDDAIHLLYRYRDGYANLDLSPHGASAYSLHRTGAAVLATSIVLAGGFSVLMLSGFRMNSTFGICSALVIVLALVYNISIMPRFLVWSGQPAP